MSARKPPRDDLPAGSGGSGSGHAAAVVDIDVADELSGSFLEYAYSVIYSRALPDARDGLKPVHRRILYQMNEMGLRPDRGHVKCARVVGEVMGRLHPHGDGAIYDALVRMAQPFAMRLPLVDGHGNFGSLGGDDPPAAMRYTECRLAAPARLLTESLDEDVVDFVPNYDGQEREPGVLPAAYPNLLVNGAAGIAVGMATNIPPHNLVEVLAAARTLLANPDATLDELMACVPGPDLPTGGQIVGLDGVREAYETGRGTFRMRATAKVEDVDTGRRGRARQAIVVTELPYAVGPEKVIGKIKELVQGKKLAGISDVKDLTDRKRGLQLVIEIKSGFNAHAVLTELYRQTPMEESFGINAVALVDGQPRTLGLKELLEVFVDARLSVVRRRCEFRRRKAAERAHILEGYLIALDGIDEIIRIIRASDDTAHAREQLMAAFPLSEIQAQHILDMPLRRLTALEVTKIRDELADLRETIAELDRILSSDAALRDLVGDEFAQVADEFGAGRRTVLLSADAVATTRAQPLEIADAPCHVLVSTTGRIARTATPEAADPDAAPARRLTGRRARHDVVRAAAPATTRGDVGLVTSAGRIHRANVLDLPALAGSAWAVDLRGGTPVTGMVELERDERVIGAVPLRDGHGLALATADGTVKRVLADFPAKDVLDVVALKPGDSVVAAWEVTDPDVDLVFITSDAQLLRTPAAGVRPQGRAASGMAGIKLGDGARVIAFHLVHPDNPDAVVVTVAGDSTSLAGVAPGSAKLTPYAEFPAKGRATGGVRCQRFLRGEDVLVAAWAGPGPALAAGPAGEPVELPAEFGRRDGSGSPLAAAVAAIGGLWSPPGASTEAVES